MLGPHLDGFDLHAFFDALTQKSRADGLIIPADREARWRWLQAQVEAEAKRRKLPIAGATIQPAEDPELLALVKRRDAGDWS